MGKGIVLYTQIKMYRLGLDKRSVVFIEWEIGKMETANVYHKLITYIIWTCQNGFEILAKLKTALIHTFYIDVTQKGCYPKRGKGVPQKSD